LLGIERLAGDEDLLNMFGVRQKARDGERGRNLADVVQVIARDDIFEPGRASLCSDGASFKILEIMHRGTRVHHDRLRIVLHRGRDREQRQSVGVPFQNLIARSEAELRFARRNELRNASILRERGQRDLQALRLVVALHQGGEEAAVFRLGIPVQLQPHGRQAIGGGLLRSTTVETEQDCYDADGCGEATD
jgi:hypothetical protein